MRIITGSGALVRKYIENIDQDSNFILFPENGKDIHEQCNYIAQLNELEEFDGDIITFSSFIISDVIDDKVFIIVDETLKMINPDFNTFGSSFNKINSQIFKYKKTISFLANKKLEEFREEIINGNHSNKMFDKIDQQLGESIEKLLILKHINN